MVPHAAPESAPHTLTVAEAVLPAVGLPAAVLEDDAGNQGRWRLTHKLRRQNLIEHPFLQSLKLSTPQLTLNYQL